MKTRLAMVPMVLLAAVLTAGPTWAQTAKPQNSGFLGDYSKLAAVADRPGVMFYVDKTGDYRPYTKVMFDPVEVVLVPNPDYKGVQPDALKRMTDAFAAALKQALAPEYQVVAAPGPDVLRVRTAITGVQPAPTDTTAADFIPIKALFNAARSASGGSPRVAEMMVEIEILDAQGKRVAAATATRKGEEKLAQGAQVTWKDLEPIAQHWAKGFRQRLDELRGVATK
jgi:hypothetical protein